jgi:hypothetical protein
LKESRTTAVRAAQTGIEAGTKRGYGDGRGARSGARLARFADLIERDEDGEAPQRLRIRAD